MIKVELFFVPKNIVGREEIFLPAKNLKELLNKLVRDYPELKEVLFKKGRKREVSDHLIIMIDGLSARKLKTPLKNGATVIIFSVISGG